MSGRGVRSSARLSGGSVSVPAADRSGSETAAEARAAAALAAAERRQRAAQRALEVEDSPRVLRDKCRRLARALRNAKHLVVYTGAGISTAAAIPDYRGPRGVWTRLQRGEPAPRVEVQRAEPTYTHMALTALWARGALKFLVSQNCDGLHLRAGLPRRALAELHGDMFLERCRACPAASARALYLRAFDTTQRTRRHAHGTRRLCHACGAELADSIVHFGERGAAPWPLNWAGALRHAARADVVLCLGSSLKVLRRYGRLWRMHRPPHLRPALYIVNLQWTPKDGAAELKINARCDDVMRAVARRLRLRVPRYSPHADPLLAHAEPLAPPEAHTSRHAPLPPPPPAPPEPPPPPSPPPSPSPSPSDSDEELPLRRLADRLREPRRDGLCAFRVELAGGAATILLRAHHASSPAPSPPRPLTSPSTPRPLVSPPTPRPLTSPHTPRPPTLASELRRVRFPRRDASVRNGVTTPAPPAPLAPSPHRRLLANGDSEQQHASPEHEPRANGLTNCVQTFATGGPKRPDEPINGTRERPEAPFVARNGAVGLDRDSRLRRLLERAPPGPPLGRHRERDSTSRSSDHMRPKTERTLESTADLKFEWRLDCRFERKSVRKLEPKAELGPEWKAEWNGEASMESGASSGEERCCGALAAAIIARALVLCRAQLYPGLHTILAPAEGGGEAAPGGREQQQEAAAECAWCWGRRGSRRCLWYGAPRLTALHARAWRTVRGARYLCACCGGGGGASPPPPPPDEPPAGAGWYGKGYRKGRRRRR